MATCYIDSHLHLQDNGFSGAREQIVANAQKAGVGMLLCNALLEEDWSAIIRLGDTYESVIPFLGIHPWFADCAAKGWQPRMMKLLSAVKNVSGIGESGLDSRCTVEFSTQRALFAAHLETAHSLAKPITLHCVRSWGPLLDILESHARNNSLPRAMIHSFNGSYETMKRLTNIGCFISFSTIMTEPRQKKIRQVFIQTPVEQLLLETDSPSRSSALLAENEKSVTPYDEPAVMPTFYRWAAQLRDIDCTELKTHIFHNAQVYTNRTIAR